MPEATQPDHRTGRCDRLPRGYLDVAMRKIRAANTSVEALDNLTEAQVCELFEFDLRALPDRFYPRREQKRLIRHIVRERAGNRRNQRLAAYQAAIRQIPGEKATTVRVGDFEQIVIERAE